MLNNIVSRVVQFQGSQARGEGGGGNKYNGTLSGEKFLKVTKSYHMILLLWKIFWEVQLFLHMYNGMYNRMRGKKVLSLWVNNIFFIVMVFIARWSKLPVPLCLSFWRAHWRPQWDFSFTPTFNIYLLGFHNSWILWWLLCWYRLDIGKSKHLSLGCVLARQALCKCKKSCNHSFANHVKFAGEGKRPLRCLRLSWKAAWTFSILLLYFDDSKTYIKGRAEFGVSSSGNMCNEFIRDYHISLI